jgi:hypothetical protein
VITNLAICRAMHWPYPAVLALPVGVYDVLLDELNKESEAA